MKTKIYFMLIAITMSSITMGQVINVPGDYQTIQEGISAAYTGDTVLVAPGIYDENINFKGKAITVASNYIMSGDTNYINHTVIDGSQPANPDSASVVTFNSGEDTTSVICGFTITGGTGTPIWATYRVGGGIFCSYGSAKILHNKIIDNTVSSSDIALGGGVFCSNNYIIIRNNIIRDNSLEGNNGSYGGGFYSYQTSCLDVSENIITQNLDITGGAGVFCQNPYGPVTVSQNVFSNNFGLETTIGYGGGLNIDDAYDYPVEIDRNQFLHNSSNNGGGFYEKNCYNLRLTNNIFIGNDGYYSGGAICNYHEEANYRSQIINNTFFNNTAGIGGGAISYFSDFTGSSPVILNCIFWENSASTGKDICNWSGDTLFVYYSDIDYDLITGQWLGEFNFLEDPELEEDSIHLSANSPCINMGAKSLYINGTTYYCPEIDIDAEERSQPDIGADEWYPGIGIIKLTKDDLELKVYPNPTSNNISIDVQPGIEVTSLEIMDNQGKVVMYQQVTKNNLTVNVSNFPKGFYIIRLYTSKGVGIKKLIIQ